MTERLARLEHRSARPRPLPDKLYVCRSIPELAVVRWRVSVRRRGIAIDRIVIAAIRELQRADALGGSLESNSTDQKHHTTGSTMFTDRWPK